MRSFEEDYPTIWDRFKDGTGGTGAPTKEDIENAIKLDLID